MPRTSPTNRRELIVNAARRGFTERGYDATTIGELANELDISKAAIAYYFPTKDVFLDEFVDPFLDDLEAAVESTEKDPRIVLGAFLDVLIRHHDIAIWFDTEPAIQRSDGYRERMAAVNERIVAVVTGRSRRKADRLRAMAVLGGVWRPARESTTDDLLAHADEIVAAALDGYSAVA